VFIFRYYRLKKVDNIMWPLVFESCLLSFFPY